MSDYTVDASVVIQHFVIDTYTVNVDALFEEVGDPITVKTLTDFKPLNLSETATKNQKSGFHTAPITQPYMIDRYSAVQNFSVRYL